MNKKILALHGLGHDTGVALFDGPELIYSIETERITRVKHDSQVIHAIEHIKMLYPRFCAEIDIVVTTTNVNEKLMRLSDRIETDLGGALHWECYCDLLGYRTKCIIVAHEAAHASIALHFGDWPRKTLVLVNEGHGSFSRNSLFYADNDLKLIDIDFLPWYATGFGWTGISALLGFGRTPSSAGKTMALSGYNTAGYDLRELFLELPEDLHNWPQERREVAGQHLLSRAGSLCKKDGVGPALAWALQAMFTERTLEEIVKRFGALGAQNVALSGGCALNLNTNSAVRSRFPSVIIPPACNDSGQAIGAGLYSIRFVLNERPKPFSVRTNGSPIASRFRSSTSDDALDWHATRPRRIAQMLSSGKVFAFCEGVSAIGPRSLGERSIIGHPGHPGMKIAISQKLKKREPFRPLAPIMTEDAFRRQFTNQALSPHMLFAYECNSDLFPEATHVDNTARIQTLEQRELPILYEVLTHFEEITGTPALINTSLNKAGTSIAHSQEDVLSDFLTESIVDGFIFGNKMSLR